MRIMLCLALFLPATATRRADVLVYGASASGILAAVAAAREGKSVLLLEPGRHVGGMVSGGLGATDTGNRGAIGGYSREFFSRVKDQYAREFGADSEQVLACSDGFKFEPHVATLVFQKMLREAKIEPLFGQRLDTVRKSGARIEAVTTRSGDTFEASVYIDASYEGDLLARAGVNYVVGRESVDEFHESLAGVQKHSPAHQWPGPVPGRDDRGGLLPGVQPDPLKPAGSGDRLVQAYNFRLCMTNRKENLIPWPKPAGYDPKRYELLARYLERFPNLGMKQLMNPVMMPNAKTDTNNNGAFSTDHIGANWDYPDADQATRERIRQDHVEYTQGFLWFLANDPRVPKMLHDEMNAWGLAKDEFTETAHWPHQLYVREARRMKGAYFMTQKDIMEERTKEDSVGLGSYNTDSHHCQRVVLDNGTVLNEGDFQVRVSPYAIPYRSLTPKVAECENLLVTVCISASHVAYGTIRMEPVYMILGQAGGLAAALALEARIPVQKVDPEILRAKLRAQKAVLSPDEIRGQAPAPKVSGILVDDPDALKTGEWTASTSTPPFMGVGYVHDGNADRGKKSIRFAPKLPSAGAYQVILHYPPHPNRASSVAVVIHSEEAEQTVRVDQRRAAPALGPFRFPAEGGWVEIRNEGADGFVVADAVEFVRAK
jgi:hypothetical protein